MSLEQKYAPGDVLFKEGEPSADVFLIKSGKVRIIKNGITIAQLGPGEFLGERGVKDRRPRSATAEAIEETYVHKIDADTLREKMEAEPIIGDLITTLVKRLRDADRRLTEL